MRPSCESRRSKNRNPPSATAAACPEARLPGSGVTGCGQGPCARMACKASGARPSASATVFGSAPVCDPIAARAVPTDDWPVVMDEAGIAPCAVAGASHDARPQADVHRLRQTRACLGQLSLEDALLRRLLRSALLRSGMCTMESAHHDILGDALSLPAEGRSVIHAMSVIGHGGIHRDAPDLTPGAMQYPPRCR